MAIDLREHTDTEPPAPSKLDKRRRGMVLVLLFALVVGGVSLWAWWPGRGADVRSGSDLVDAQGLADRYGIDITLVGISAAGGIVDFRYQVVDPDKADAVIHDINTYPKLVVEDTGATLALRSLPHSHNRTLELGGNYFFLMPNAENAIHAGDLVTIVVGDVRLEHVPVEG